MDNTAWLAIIFALVSIYKCQEQYTSTAPDISEGVTTEAITPTHAPACVQCHYHQAASSKSNLDATMIALCTMLCTAMSVVALFGQCGLDFYKHFSRGK